MGNKVGISEVIAFSDNVGDVVKGLQSALKNIESNIQVIEQMDSFSGKAAKSAKKYFKDFHSTINNAFDELFTSIDGQLSSHIAIFKSDVDSSESALIDSDYLNSLQCEITSEYNGIIQISGEINKTISNISDISSVSAPGISLMNEQNEVITEHFQKVDEKLNSFISIGKGDTSKTKKLLDELEKILLDVGKLKGEGRFTSYYEGSKNINVVALGKSVKLLSDSKTSVTGAYTSYKMYLAAKKAGLRTETVIVNGEKFYRVLATREALRIFGIKPDEIAERQLNYLLPKNGKPLNAKQRILAENNAAILKFASQKDGKDSGWSKTGKALIDKYPEMSYWNDRPDIKFIAKTVGKESIKGAGTALKEALDIKSVVKSSNAVKGSVKALGPLGAGLTYYSNYIDAEDDGLSTKKAHTRALADTAIDTAVGGAVQAGSVALFTAIVPIPGLGTAIGVGVGLGINYLLSKRPEDKYGKEKNASVMDKIKGFYH